MALLFASCGAEDEYVRVTFRVEAKISSGDTIFIAGSTPELAEWYPNRIPLLRITGNIWQKSIRMKKGELVDYKFTLGDWAREQTDEYGNISINKQILPLGDTTVLHQIKGWRVDHTTASLLLDEHSIFPNSSPVIMNYHWRYTPSDSAHFPELRYDDSGWQLSDSYLGKHESEKKAWNGLGWFRLHLWVDSSLWGRTVAFHISQLGASEIYINGKREFSFGTVSMKNDEFIPRQNHDYFPLRLDTMSHQVIAVRYAAPHYEDIQRRNLDAGFIISLNDLSTVMMRQGDEAQMHIYYQQLFTLLPLAMAFFHFTLFLFFPQFRENLFYAVCLTGYAGLVYYYELMGTETDIYQIFYYAKLAGASNFVSQVFGLLTMYTILKPESLNRIRVFFAVGVVLLLTGMYFSGEPFNYFTFGFLLITVSELIYISVTTTIRDKNARIIMVSGITVLIFFIAWQLLIDFGWFEHPGGYYLLVNYGFLGLMLSMTTYLSYEFAKTNKDLSQRIQTIELLTEEKISKEREALQAETERKLIAAEYERKSAELEDARKLQISMLPKSLPQIDCYTARVRMETAAEVGGDYYDIRQYTKHDNFVIVGDATGHGAKAGIMVTITKSLLAVLDLRKGLAETIIQLNKSIKSIGLHSLYMSLLAAELGERGIRYISAGMPPVFVYRKKERTTDTVISKSMPLGAFADFQYSIQNIDLDGGDCVIFVTDGLTELFNKQQEIFGIERTAEVINTILAANPTEHFLDRLFEEIKKWGNGQLNDDITVMILEYKGKN
ncbi:MAG: SpoIIE family protein phosphatase [Ignavibacteriales bacterium]|nr:MAG: SpoIIE family protein phosphatase [Ignavibacteriales bacterium]